MGPRKPGTSQDHITEWRSPCVSISANVATRCEAYPSQVEICTHPPGEITRSVMPGASVASRRTVLSSTCIDVQLVKVSSVLGSVRRITSNVLEATGHTCSRRRVTSQGMCPIFDLRPLSSAKVFFEQRPFNPKRKLQSVQIAHEK